MLSTTSPSLFRGRAASLFRAMSSATGSRKLAHRGSPGILVDPYVPEDRKPPTLSLANLARLKRSVAHNTKSGFARGRMQRAMSDFTPSMFPVEAERIFRQVQDGYALADVGALRGLVTEEVLSALKKDLKRALKTGERRAARILGFEEPTKVVQFRQLVQSSSDQSHFWGQITVRMVPRYAVGVYDRRGNYVRDLEAMAEGEDLSTLLPLMEPPTCSWRVAKADNGDSYYFDHASGETTWNAPPVHVDEPRLYAQATGGAGSSDSDGGSVSGDAKGGDDALRIPQSPQSAAAAPAESGRPLPLSIVRECYTVFERPAFIPEQPWRVMLIYTPQHGAKSFSRAAGYSPRTQYT